MSNRFQSFDSIAVPGVQGLSPYQPGKPESELKREYGLKQITKLASNENPLGSSANVIEAITQELSLITRYPDGAGFELKSVLAKRHGVAMDTITLGSGSSEVIELVARVFVAPGDEVIFSQHAFAMYPIITQAVGGQAVEVPACEWGHDLTAIATAISENTRVIFIANPNNPTGTWLGHDALQRFLAEVPERVVVVIDEAYFEYATEADTGANGYPDATQWLEVFPNLVVTRTFSKAFGLAGLRVGYSLSSPVIADLMNRIRPPFNVNTPAQVAALATLDDTHYLQKSLAVNTTGMLQLTEAFEKRGLAYIPSIANFVSVEVGDHARVVYDALLKRGVIVRPVANYGMPRHLRVSIGTEQENRHFLSALTAVLSEEIDT
ncbi:MAG: histidinol-phosphate transaminase [Gammaproteobacteria bacterium]|nr:histidinol-phosphate transaminase [Gammaproteobacteria bacterium]MCF6231234.1 histidinol-phosphate transaminase [Gammaproteobacteria bacterium]